MTLVVVVVVEVHVLYRLDAELLDEIRCTYLIWWWMALIPTKYFLFPRLLSLFIGQRISPILPLHLELDWMDNWLTDWLSPPWKLIKKWIVSVWQIVFTEIIIALVVLPRGSLSLFPVPNDRGWATTCLDPVLLTPFPSIDLSQL